MKAESTEEGTVKTPDCAKSTAGAKQFPTRSMEELQDSRREKLVRVHHPWVSNGLRCNLFSNSFDYFNHLPRCKYSGNQILPAEIMQITTRTREISRAHPSYKLE